jgi:hypothetical protein
MTTQKPPSDEYLVHQARQFHRYAKENLTTGAPPGAAIANLAISVEYLIELEEKRLLIRNRFERNSRGER